MYDPLIKISHNVGENTFVRASDIVLLLKWDNKSKVVLKSGYKFAPVANMDEVIFAVNAVDEYNERAGLQKQGML